MTAEQTAAERYTERIEAQVDEMIRMIAASTDQHWFHRAAPDEWTAAEVCGHIAELLPYWTAKIRQAIATPDMMVGRDEDDPDRIGGVRTGAGWSRHDAIERVRAAVHTAVQDIRSYSASDWHATINRAERGPISVDGLLDAGIAQHLESHVEQVRHALG